MYGYIISAALIIIALIVVVQKVKVGAYVSALIVTLSITILVGSFAFVMTRTDGITEFTDFDWVAGESYSSDNFRLSNFGYVELYKNDTWKKVKVEKCDNGASSGGMILTEYLPITTVRVARVEGDMKWFKPFWRELETVVLSEKEIPSEESPGYYIYMTRNDYIIWKRL